MCIVVVVGGHGRVATAHQIAPWSRGSDLLSPTAVGDAFRSTSVGGYARSQSDMGIAQRSPIARCTPHEVGSAPSYAAGDGYGHIELWACQTVGATTARKSVICH